MNTPNLEPMTADNTAVLLVDHQIGLFTGVRDMGTAELGHNVTALAKAAQRLRLPLVVTTTASDGMWGPLVPELAGVLPDDLEVIDRGNVNAWHDARVRRAVESTGRRKLIVAGVSLEVCAALPAMAALADGFDTYVAVDASGTFSATKRDTGLLRLTQAGVVVADYASLMVEILADNTVPEAGDVYAALDMPFASLVGQLAAAFAPAPALLSTTDRGARMRPGAAPLLQQP